MAPNSAIRFYMRSRQKEKKRTHREKSSILLVTAHLGIVDTDRLGNPSRLNCLQAHVLPLWEARRAVDADCGLLGIERRRAFPSFSRSVISASRTVSTSVHMYPPASIVRSSSCAGVGHRARWMDVGCCRMRRDQRGQQFRGDSVQHLTGSAYIPISAVT